MKQSVFRYEMPGVRLGSVMRNTICQSFKHVLPLSILEGSVMKLRRTKQVLTDLIAARQGIVRSYPQGVQETASTVERLLPGIAAFAVGTGLACDPWRDFFPESPILFVGHNWGNQRMLLKAQRLSGEGDKVFWRRLRDFVREAGKKPEEVQVTNVLQGIKAGPAAGTMTTDKTFVGECLVYLRDQVRIVGPRLLVSLGAESDTLCRRTDRECRLGVAIVSIMHPSTRARNWGGSYHSWVEAQARRIREALW